MTSIPHSMLCNETLGLVTAFARTVMAPERRAPMTRYATFQPCLDSPAVHYGTATRNPGGGYTWQQDGCDWTLQIGAQDYRLRLYGRVRP